jgi:hypothetical protein
MCWRRNVDIFIINHDGFNNLETLGGGEEDPTWWGRERDLPQPQHRALKMFNSIVNGNKKKTDRQPKERFPALGTPPQRAH